MITVQRTGPLFDGRGGQFFKEIGQDIERGTAREGARMVRDRLNVVLKVQTPHYRTRIRSMPDSPNRKITDQGVIYGPWLEGIGSRNAPVTRFRGYHTFKFVSLQLNGRAQGIAEQIVVRYLGRIG